jgi:hypothetical protein
VKDEWKSDFSSAKARRMAARRLRTWLLSVIHESKWGNGLHHTGAASGAYEVGPIAPSRFRIKSFARLDHRPLSRGRAATHACSHDTLMDTLMDTLLHAPCHARVSRTNSVSLAQTHAPHHVCTHVCRHGLSNPAPSPVRRLNSCTASRHAYAVRVPQQSVVMHRQSWRHAARRSIRGWRG